MRGTLQHVQDTLADAFGANQKKMEQVEVSKHEGELAIKQAFEQLHEALEERKKALLSELGTIALTQTTGLILQKEHFEEIQQDISHYSEVISHILQTHTDHEVVAMGGLVPIEMKVTIKRLEVIPPIPNMLENISVDVQPDGLVKEKYPNLVAFSMCLHHHLQVHEHPHQYPRQGPSLLRLRARPQSRWGIHMEEEWFRLR